MISESIFYAIFAYALAFFLAAVVAGMIKVIQFATRGRQGGTGAAPAAEAAITEVKQS